MTNQKREPEQIRETAKHIAQLIAEVDTDFRGDLLSLAGVQLRREGQGFKRFWKKKASAIPKRYSEL